MQKSCTNCSTPFTITEDDLSFFDKISPVLSGRKKQIPPPLLCPDCRFQRRMIWRREHALKSRVCSNCRTSIISIHAEDVAYPVYCYKCWWADAFDPLSYGKEVNVEQSFLEQFRGLMETVPQITLVNDNGVSSENCEYSQDFSFGKNCYLITGCWELQDCYYSDCNCLKSRHLFDCYSIHFSELVYDSIASQHLYRCIYMNRCENCHDSSFGTDLKGCHHCIGCIGLRQKEFCIFNEQYSESEYHQRVAALNLNSYEGFQRFKKQYEKWILKFPRKYANLVHCENCIGDDLFNCKNVMGFQEAGAEYCKFIVHGDAPKNSYDVSQTGRCEWCYEGATPDNSYMSHFTTWCWKDKNVMYSDNCHNCEDVFGCIALKHKKYCILNKQYSKEEYEELVSKIIDRMIVDKEWGEFFPMKMSPHSYNETAAQEYYPLTKDQAMALGVKWSNNELQHTVAQNIIIPDRIEEVSEDIIKDTLACQNCRRNFKILDQELAFYKDMKIPLPRNCYDCRYNERVKRRNPRKLWNRACAKCSKEIHTSYAPDRREIVYCEDCYLKEVY